MKEIDYGLAVIAHLALIGFYAALIWHFIEPERKRLMNWLRNRKET